jgi:outer membrane protein
LKRAADLRRPAVLAAALTGAAFAALPASAQDREPKWFARAGVIGLDLADELELEFAGSPVPGADISTKTHYTPTVQVGRFIGRNFALSFTGGIPPQIDIQGKGALEPFGKLAETTYGPVTLTVQYRPLRSGTFQPYVGAGAAYMHIFDTTDGAFSDVEIDDDLSPALEAGTDIMFTRRYGLYFEAKKAFLRTETRGTFGGAPVVGQVKLDPWAFSAGAVVRF